MRDKDYYLFAGVIIGAILWASINALLENNGVFAIFGLAFSSMMMGFGLGLAVIKGDKHEA